MVVAVEDRELGAVDRDELVGRDAKGERDQCVDLQQGLAAVVILHDLNLALRFADQFLVMKEGAVCAFGGREVVDPGMIWEVYGVQAQVLEVNGRPVVVPQ